MTDVRTTRDLHHPRSSHRGTAAFLIFLILLIGAGIFVAAVMNMHGSISWPAGQIEFGLKSPLPQG
jgi:hypothetical protein